jgi:hypothetical protein
VLGVVVTPGGGEVAGGVAVVLGAAGDAVADVTLLLSSITALGNAASAWWGGVVWGGDGLRVVSVSVVWGE